MELAKSCRVGWRDAISNASNQVVYLNGNLLWIASLPHISTNLNKPITSVTSLVITPSAICPLTLSTNSAQRHVPSPRPMLRSATARSSPNHGPVDSVLGLGSSWCWLVFKYSFTSPDSEDWPGIHTSTLSIFQASSLSSLSESTEITRNSFNLDAGNFEHSLTNPSTLGFASSFWIHHWSGMCWDNWRSEVGAKANFKTEKFPSWACWGWN